MDETDALGFMDRLHRAFLRTGGPPKDPGNTYKIYVEKLVAFDYEVGRLAVEKTIDTEDRFPSVAKLLVRLQSAKSDAVMRNAGRGGLVEEPALTPAQAKRRRARCVELIDRKHGWELIEATRDGDTYWTQRLGACEDELDRMLQFQYSRKEWDDALRNYYACLDGCARWGREKMRPAVKMPTALQELVAQAAKPMPPAQLDLDARRAELAEQARRLGERE